MFAENLHHAVQYVFIFAVCNVRVQRGKGIKRQSAYSKTHHPNRKKSKVPTPQISKHQSSRNPCHGGDRKRRHHDASSTPASRKRNHIPNNGLRHGVEHATKKTSCNTRRHQPKKCWRDTTSNCGEGKQGVERQQQVFAIKPIYKSGGK